MDKDIPLYDLATQDYHVLEEMISKNPSLITKKDSVGLFEISQKLFSNVP